MKILVKILGILLLLTLTLVSCKTKSTVNEDDYKMDLRYAPIWGQTSICLPDEIQKTIVDDKGAVYYDFKRRGPFNGFNTTMFAGLDTVESVDVSQHLYSSKVPVILTSCNKRKILFSTEIFAIAPALKTSAGDSCELSKGFRGMPHNDIIIVKIRNTSEKDTLIIPKFFVKSTYPVEVSEDKRSLYIDKRISVSLPDGVINIAEGSDKSIHFYTVDLNKVLLKAGTSNAFTIVVNIGSKAMQVPSSLDDAEGYKTKAIAYWNSYKFPYDHITVPDSNIQNLVNSCIRNIYQAREIKKGLPAFQVGPTVYRGLWIIDGSFLLESMTFLGQSQDVRNGIEYMLSFQKQKVLF